jgi:protein TonB
MAAIHAAASDRDRARLDGRAIVVVVLFHALLVAWFANQHGTRPLRPALAPLVLVDLQEALFPPAKHEQRSALLTAAASPAAHRALEQAATPSRQRTQPRQGRDVVVPEGHEAVSVPAAASLVPPATTSTPMATGAGSSASLATRGTGTYAGPHFRPPRVRHRSLPGYPADAFLAHRQGSVDVIVTVSADGEPVEAQVHQSSGTESLDAAAVAAVKAWTFRAAERNGNATEAQAIVTIDWSIGADTTVAGPAALPSAPASGMSAREQLACLQRSRPELCR